MVSTTFSTTIPPSDDVQTTQESGPSPDVTKALYQHDGTLHHHQTTVLTVVPATSLSDGDRALFKSITDSDSVVATAETIFHAQGGGQPSDTGSITSLASDSTTTFDVLTVRHAGEGRILHHGRFSPADSRAFEDGESVEQHVDSDKRLLHSRIHTAGHILGLAVRQLADTIPDITELKAQHYPDAAFVEFRGLIDGKHKAAIQERADDLVRQAIPVHVVWWGYEELKEKCAVVLDSVDASSTGLMRAVNIEGVGAYPCGGTHVTDTSRVGKLVVRNIKRQKGITKISYAVEEV